MNHENFLVRPHLELVEKFGEAGAWDDPSITDLAALADRVARLPDQLEPDHEDAKRFDVLILKAQLALLTGDAFERQRTKVVQIASLLEDQQAIPAIKQHLALILDVQSEEWWVDVTYPMLEQVRRKLRSLVPLIERSKKKIVYTDFMDEIGDAVEVSLPGTTGGGETYEFMQFRKRAEAFLKDHLGEAVVAKVRSGEPLTAADMADLQRILVAESIGDDSTFAIASERAGNFGLFIRSLVGLDRAAAKAAFADFLDDKRYSKNQIEFINLVINELTDRGVVEVARVYESPYDSVAPEGPDELFSGLETELNQILAKLEELKRNAIPSTHA